MRIIKATNIRLPILVDDDDYDELNKYDWRIAKTGYVVRSEWDKVNKTTKTIYMHRSIMNTPEGMDCEHEDLNRTNNQKANLRTGTRSQNMANQRARGGLSRFKGVSKLNRPNLKKPWIAYIKHNYKQIHLGYFETQEEAAEAYNIKAKEIYEEFARFNNVKEDNEENKTN